MKASLIRLCALLICLACCASHMVACDLDSFGNAPPEETEGVTTTGKVEDTVSPIETLPSPEYTAAVETQTQAKDPETTRPAEETTTEPTPEAPTAPAFSDQDHTVPEPEVPTDPIGEATDKPAETVPEPEMPTKPVEQESTSEPSAEHDHHFSERVVLRDATCTQDGKAHVICSICGYKEIEMIPATGHEEGTWEIIREPNCYQEGVRVIPCIRCGNTIAKETIQPTYEHVPGEFVVTTPPTCMDYGRQEQSCTVCGYVLISDPVPPVDHIPGTWEVVWEASCSQEGYERLCCAECGTIIQEKYTGLGDHRPGPWITVTEPSCNTEGYRERHCDFCGYCTESEIIPPTYAHQPGEWQVTTQPTCAYEGVEELQCVLCHFVLESRMLPKTEEHVSGFWRMDYTPSCTYEGIEYLICDDCGVAYDSRPVPATGHVEGPVVTEIWPTCTDWGLELHNCTYCGYTMYTIDLLPLGHTVGEWETLIYPSCTEQGVEVQKCSFCWLELDRRYTPTTDHVPGEWFEHISGTDCTTPSEWHQLCVLCNNVINVESRPSTGHSSAWRTASEAGCTTDGLREEYCESCGLVLSTEIIPAMGHGTILSRVISEVSCTTDGVREDYCVICDLVLNTETIPAMGHVEGAPVYNPEPDCYRDGVKYVYCITCGEFISSELIPSPGHILSEWTVDPAPTCTDIGRNYRYCLTCTLIIDVQVLNPTGHQNTETHLLMPPTCGQEGSQETVCLDCGTVVSVTSVPTVPHERMNWEVIQAPTCTDIGYQGYICVDCGYVEETQPIEATGHTINPEWISIKAPTCTEPGLMVQACTGCGIYINEEVFPSTGHAPGEWKQSYGPTCNDPGLKNLFCAYCEQPYQSEPIPALGHTPGDWEIVDQPTCTAYGYKHRLCTVCFTMVENGNVEPTGHQNCTTRVVTEATCIGYGYHQYVCLDCNTVLQHIDVNPLGHLTGPWVDTSQPTCTEDGLREQFCQRCPQMLNYVTVPATGHSPADWVVDVQPTCTVKGHSYQACSVCTDVLEEKELPTRHSFDGATCTLCGCDYYTEGLSYVSNADGTCSVAGRGDATDAHVIVPAVYDGMQVVAIADGAFANDTLLTAVTLPDIVTTLGSRAFSGCTSLTSYTANKITAIGALAFNGCTALTRIVIPEGVTSIGNSAFYHCTAVTEILFNAVSCADMVHNNLGFACVGQATDGTILTIGSTVTRIPAYAFNAFNAEADYATRITRIIFNENSTPSFTVGTYAFDCCPYLTEVYFNVTDCVDFDTSNSIFDYAGSLGDGLTLYVGANVTRIPANMFRDPSNDFGSDSKLIRVVFAENSSCLTVGEYAFAYNKKLTEINLPASITTIGKAAFEGCVSLTEAIIPAGVTSLGGYVFNGCTALTSIRFNAAYMSDLQNYHMNFFNAGMSSEGITVTVGKEAGRIPGLLFDGLHYSGNQSQAPHITTVVFEEGGICADIGVRAFGYCAYLTSIQIPQSMNSIRGNAFYMCEALETVYAHSVHSWLIIDFSEPTSNPMYYGADLIINGQPVGDIVIPDGFRDIPNYAFYGCKNLTGVVISDSVQSIPFQAFYNCTALTSVTVGEGVTMIFNSAFAGCTALEELIFNAVSCERVDMNNEAFYNAGSLGNGIAVTFGAKVQTVPENLFGGYREVYANVTSVIFAPGSACTTIGAYAFKGCTTLSSITIPEKVTTIGDYAFAGCTALTEIFYNAINCRDLDIGNSLFRNGGSEAGGITLTIGKSVERIPQHLFYSAPNLVTVTFEDNTNLTDIAYGAFYYCETLTRVNITDVTAWCKLNFIHQTANPMYYAGEVYLNGEPLTHLVIPADIPYVLPYAFAGCTTLTSIRIPSNVGFVNNYAFSGCVNVTEIYYDAANAGDLQQSNFAFNEVGKNTDGVILTVGPNATKIPDYMFSPWVTTEGAPRITQVIFEDNSTCISIGKYAFAYCASLETVTIPASVDSIGECAFSNCAALSTLYLNSEWTLHLPGKNYAFATGGSFDLILGSTVKGIGDYTFANASIASMRMEDGCQLSQIGQYAFAEANQLTNIILPANLSALGDYAFYNCSMVTEIRFLATELGDLPFNFHAMNCVGQNTEGVRVIIGKSVTAIPAYMFAGSSDTYNPKIISLEFEEGSLCTSIGQYAFKEAAYLTRVIIPDSVTTIGIGAFTGCTGLTHLTIGKGVTVINNNAFMGCTALQELNFNAVSCDDLASDNRAFIRVGNLAEGGTTLNVGKDVTRIPAYLFYTTNQSADDRNYISTIRFEEGSACTTIGQHAFYHTADLTELSLPDAVTTVGRNAFFSCAKLATLYLGNGLATIGDYAWDNCYALTELTIPATVTSIGNSAFGGCTGLTTIVFNAVACEDGATTSSRPFYKSGSAITEQPVTVVFGEDVTRIPKSLLSYSNVSQIRFLGHACTVIGSEAFGYCDRLTTVTIPDSITTVLGNAFIECDGITKLTVGKGVTHIGNFAFELHNLETLYFNAVACGAVTGLSGSPFTEAGSLTSNGFDVIFGAEVTAVPDYLFSCVDLKIGNVSFAPGSVCTTIGQAAFQHCYGLTEILIPDHITTIGDSAFSYCKNLTTVTIGKGVTTIGKYAFRNTHALTTVRYNAVNASDLTSSNYVFYEAGMNTDGVLVYVGADVTYIPAYLFNPYNSSTSGVAKVSSLFFDENSCLTAIGGMAFAYCTSLTQVELPDSVTAIGSRAFEGCTAMNIATLPTANGYKIFGGCTSLRAVTVKGGSVGRDAFSGCTSLRTLSLDSTITEIGEGAFSGCTALTSLHLPASLTKIESSTFSGCTGLTTLVLSDKITTVGSNAFSGCSGLTSLTIGAAVKTIGYGAFKDCTGLTTVYFNAIDCNDLDSSNAVFQCAGQASDGLTLVVGADVTRIPAYLFQPSATYGSSHVPHLVGITFADGSVCTTIGNSAFEYCNDITHLVLPESLETVGQYAFSSCDNLMYVYIPAGMTDLDLYSFVNCPRLVEICNDSLLDLMPVDNHGSYVTSYALRIYTSEEGESMLMMDEDGYVFFVDEANGIYRLINYLGSDTELTLPDTVGGHAYDINACAFSAIKSITSVVIPEGVTAIGNYAFNNCESLASISLPESLVSIGEHAFSRTALTEIVIPEGVTSIGMRALYSCSRLTSVTIIGATADNWWCARNVNAQSGTVVDLTDPATAAQAFLQTYESQYWFRTVTPEETPA